ncbi:MAG: hypothetical protein ACRDS0_30280 [Pseudonocardiaceae bacterium]
MVETAFAGTGPERDVLLATKMRVPRPRPGWVASPRLVQRLRAGTTSRRSPPHTSCSPTVGAAAGTWCGYPARAAGRTPVSAAGTYMPERVDLHGAKETC